LNIFYLSHDPAECARFHVNRHTTKMILEYAQLLSTAHRVLDGVELNGLSDSGRKKKFWTLGDSRDYKLYKATHINHPSAIWARKTHQNYIWLSQLLHALCKEYTYRYGKIHKVERDGLLEELYEWPIKIPIGEFTEPTPAMPDDVKVAGDSLASYRNYYNQNKTHLADWKNRPVPQWFHG
jgi:hypothetical protein